MKTVDDIYDEIVAAGKPFGLTMDDVRESMSPQVKDMPFRTHTGPAPEKCQHCNRPIVNVFIDGRDYHGDFGHFCKTCYTTVGMGFGIGKGQKYMRTIQVNKPDIWVRVEG